MTHEINMSLLDALRAGRNVNDLIEEFQEQIMDAADIYEKEQAAAAQEKNEKMREDDLIEIRENLAVDLLEWLDATELIPAEKLEELGIDDVVQMLKEVEKMHVEISKAKEEWDRNWKSVSRLTDLFRWL